jgi:hypothetical protein
MVVLMLTQRSWMRHIAFVVAASVPLQASAAPKGKCVHWFGICVSCEAPLTCSNSRSVEAPQSGDTPSSLGSILSGLIPSTGKEGQQPTGTLQPPKKASRAGPPAAPADPDFESFKKFLQAEGISARRSSDKEIRELYARFKQWKASEPQKTR